MLVSDDQTQPNDAAPVRGATARAGHELISRIALRPPPEAIPHVMHLRAALGRYRASAAPVELSGALPYAVALVSAMQSPAGGRPELEELRRLAKALPEFGELLSYAAAEAERVIYAGTAGVWRSLGLRSAAPSWTAAERDAARMVFACACVPATQMDPVRFQAGLRAVAAPRFATLLCGELAESEEAWTRALGDRYESVRHRCARRTTWRSLGLSDLLRGDEVSRRAVTGRLVRWMASGGMMPALAAELEAALVHARTPARFA
jgi:hypothetical protein